MNFLRNKAVIFLTFLIILILFGILYTIFLYTGILNLSSEQLRVISFIIGLVLFLILGLLSGKKELTKGWLRGFTSSIILLSFIVLYRLITKTFDNWFYIIKYLAYLVSAVLGGIIGVNLPSLPFIRKKNEHL